MKHLSLVFAMMLVCVSMAFAQRTISGTVTDENGEPLPFANVFVEGVSIGTTTDMDGNYKLKVPEGSTTLVVSFTGYNDQKLTIGDSNSLNFSMAEGVLLTDVVVTALGIERSEKALGYAVQEVKAEELTRSGATNPVDALVGKSSGIQVTRSSGSAGGGSRILIRGVTSMVGDNQPLIVIDGVRTNNDTNLSQGETSGTAASNRLMDLNPEDIESVNVLKGAAATALYGTAGATGVVLITTKKGKRGSNSFNVNFTTSVGFDQITKTIDLQDQYAQGSEGFYIGPETGASGSWGPQITDLEYSTDQDYYDQNIRTFYNEFFDNETNYTSRAFNPDGTYRYDNNGYLVPKGEGDAGSQPANLYNNVDDFFQTGLQLNNSLAIEGGGETATFRLSLSDLRANGVIPNEKYDRKTVKLAAELKPIDRLTVGGSANYSRSDYVRVQQGSNTSGLLLGMLRTPISFDNANGFDEADAVDQVSAYQFPSFAQRNYRGGGGYDNPYWIINNALGFEEVDRVFGNVKADYSFHKWANLSLNMGYDMTSDRRKQTFEKGSRTNASGAILIDEFATKIFDNNIILAGGDSFGEDINLSYLAGANTYSYNLNQSNVDGFGLVFPGFLDISNATSLSSFNDQFNYRTLGFYGQIEAGWRSTLYMTLSARQDYDSRLGDPVNFDLSKTGFFYPSASMSVVFSELFNTNNGPLSFGKLRVSWAQVGAGPPDPYSTQSVFVSPLIGDGWGDDIGFPIAGNSAFDQSSLLGNNELTPELSTTTELGLDLRFFKDRVGIDATVYQTKIKDAILNASLAPSSGYTNVWLNSGEMTSRGIELTLNLIPVKSNKFNWNSQINFTKSESIVDKLAPGIERLFLAGFNAAGTYLVQGNQYGAIFGGAYLREEAGTDKDTDLNIPDGAVVINTLGSPDPAAENYNPEYGYQAVDDAQRAIGNPNPDFIIGWNNSLSFGPVSANFLFDWRQGGDLWNGTAWALSFFGRSQLTADTREEAAVPIEGVLADGTPNDIPVVRDENYWTSSLGGFGAVGEQFVQDGGWIRLREVGLSYRLPSGGWFKGGSLGVSGRNLWFHSEYDGIDPETSLTGTGNGQGFDYFNMPSTRSVFVKLSLNL